MRGLYLQGMRLVYMSMTAGTGAASETMVQTQPTALQVQEDLQQLKPNVVMDTIRGWAPGLLSFAYRLLIAAVIIFIGVRVARLVHRFLKKTFERTELDLSVSKFLLSAADVAVYALAVFIAAEKIGIPSASIIALLGSAGLAVGLSLQGSLANVAGGILILLMRPFVIGDYIVCEGTEGTVKNIGLVYTTLTTVDNKIVTVPNGRVSNATIVNVTAQEKRRVDMEVGIGYSSDMKRAKEIIRQIYESHPLVLADEGITVYVGELAASAVIIGGRGWTRTENYWKVKWEITEAVKERFDAEGIEIPFNQIDVNIRGSLQ